jgi:hypothetical protein
MEWGTLPAAMANTKTCLERQNRATRSPASFMWDICVSARPPSKLGVVVADRPLTGARDTGMSARADRKRGYINQASDALRRFL